jgi:hypothetical protein
VLSAERRGWEVVGIRDSYDGLFEEGGVVSLDRKAVSGITHQGGTILGTTNRGNPLRWPVKAADGGVTYEDRSDAVLEALARNGVEALIAIGGDGSLAIAHSGSAGRSRWLGKRPKVRGVAMNPVDHPMGGGEGKTSGGGHPVSPWGKKAKGKKTRNNKRTDHLIVKRRPKNKA